MTPKISLLTVLLAALAPPSGQDPAPQEGPEVIEIDEGPARDAARERERIRLEEEYFLTSDRNGNGWISFREARVSLRIDREEFVRYDTDLDGRIDRGEFGRRYRRMIETSGGFRAPVPPLPTRPAVRSGSLLAYDFNGTGALELGEVRRLLADRGLRVGAPAMLTRLDADGSGALESSELAEISEAMAELVGARASEVPPPAPQTIEELFGGFVDREDTFGTSQLPPRIPGPVTHFRRLDFDDDGYIEIEDLMGLLSAARVDVPAGAVIAALDADGDGRLSEAEFIESLQD